MSRNPPSIEYEPTFYIDEYQPTFYIDSCATVKDALQIHPSDQS